MAVPLPAPRSTGKTDPERRLRRRAVGAGPPLLVVALIAVAGFAALVLTSA